MIKTSARAVALAALMAAAAPAVALADGDNPVIARVNGAEIHRSDLDLAIQQLPQKYQSAPMEALYPALLTNLINAELLAAKAEADGLAKDPGVQRQLDWARTQILQRAMLRTYLEKNVTEDEVKARYEDYKKNYDAPEQVRASHILVKTEDEAKAIIEELKKGTDFKALAQEKSTGPSGPDGGNLGYFSREQMVPEFSKAAFALNKGQITQEPVQTQFGWHVIKVTDKRVMEAPPYDKMRDGLRGEISGEKAEALAKSLRDAAKIERFGPDGKPVAEK